MRPLAFLVIRFCTKTNIRCTIPGSKAACHHERVLRLTLSTNFCTNAFLHWFEATSPCHTSLHCHTGSGTPWGRADHIVTIPPVSEIYMTIIMVCHCPLHSPSSPTLYRSNSESHPSPHGGPTHISESCIHRGCARRRLSSGPPLGRRNIFLDIVCCFLTNRLFVCFLFNHFWSQNHQNVFAFISERAC